MGSQTIVTKFDPSALPRWARNDGNVVSLCKESLEFRCDVCAATTDEMRSFLKRKAARWAEQHAQESVADAAYAEDPEVEEFALRQKVADANFLSRI